MGKVERQPDIYVGEIMNQMLKFIIHWEGECHTEFEMPKPVSGVGQKTSLEDLEIKCKSAVPGNLCSSVAQIEVIVAPSVAVQT